MAFAEKPILDPEQSKPGVPLKRSTLAVIVILLLTLGFVSSLILSQGMASAPRTEANGKELRQFGNSQVLRDEEEKAAKVAAAAAKAAASAPQPLPPLPASVRRDDNSAALYDKKPRAGASPPAGRGREVDPEAKDLELEAASRMAKLLAHDFDDRSAAQSQQAQQSAVRSSSSGEESPSAQAPSAALSPQIDAFKKTLMQAPAGGKAEGNWLKDYEQEGAAGRKAITGYHAPKGLVLRQGKIIPAALGRQVNSDLPGRITAYVSSNVYDRDGNLLIPMGASLVGRYDSGVKVGQSRLMFAFERLILPNGYSFDLPAAPGNDLAGASGMTGDVNNHFFKMFGTSLLIAILADMGKQPQAVTQLGSSGPATGAGQVLADVSKSILERNRTIAPTITIDQGTRINVEVVADMVFPETYRAR